MRNPRNFAKPLEGGPGKLIGEAQDIFQSAGVSAVNVLPNTLSPGVYKLEAVVSLSLPGNEPTPVSAFHESGLINVY